MKRKFIAVALGLILSANLKAQTAQDFKQTYADLAVFEDPLALKLKKGLRKSNSIRLLILPCAGSRSLYLMATIIRSISMQPIMPC
jgi:hypothetical protein